MKLSKLKIKLLDFLTIWENPICALVLAFLIYAMFASFKGPIWSISRYSYYNYLADAFLHKQLYLRIIPPQSTHDLVYYGGQYYLYWPPMPAVILMPFIAIFGINFSDVFFTLMVSAVNVGLVAQMLRRASLQNLLQLSIVQRALLVLFFACGTVHLTLSPLGRVWFTGQIIGFFFTALAFLIPLSLKGWKSFLLTGTVVACAALTRNHLLFIGIWPAFLLIKNHLTAGWKKLLGYVFIGLIPLAIAGLAYFSYNWLRFGNILNVGLDYHQMADIFMEEYKRYGAFNLHYFPKNFFYHYISYPFPIRSDTFMGGSLFLLSPVFWGAFWGVIYGKPRVSIFFLLLTIVAIDIPILLLMGTGWVQFGPRYTLDFTIPLLWLTAVGIRRWPDSITSILSIISMVHYIAGYLVLLTNVG